MTDTIALSYHGFNEKVKVNKKQVIKIIEAKVLDAKLELLREGLNSNNIAYDKSINDYDKLVLSLRKNLETRHLSIANTLIDKINSSIDGMISELEKGSESAFSRFLSKIEKILAPIGNTAINGLAASTLLTLAPTPLAKAGVGIVLTGISLYNMSKLDKVKMVTNKTYELNKILEELEITRDKDGNVIDTRFGTEIVHIIKDFLYTNNVNFMDTGYLSLREIIYSLNNETKEKLCHVLNQLKGNVINIDERLEDVNSSLLARIKNKFVKPASIGMTGGVGVATVINNVNSGLLASLYNTAIVKFIVEKFTNSPVISWISGVISGGVSLFGQFIPVVGTIIDKICSIENIAVLAIVGAGAGILSTVGKGIYNAIKNRKKNFQTQKEMKKIQELDMNLYGASDIVEVKRIREIALAGNEKYEKIIVNAVCEYMDELGISYSQKVTNLSDLKEVINLLDKHDKVQVNSLLEALLEFLQREPNNFKRYLDNALKSVKILATLGLASMSIVNILTAGGFLNSIKEKIFAKYGYTIEPLLSSFDDSKGIEEFNKNGLKPSTKIGTNVIHGTNIGAPEPLPGPGPQPSATPSPLNIITNPKDIISKPTIDITQLVINGDEAAWQGLTNLSTEELYRVLANSHDPEWAYKALEKLTTNDFTRIREYMETSGALARSDPGYAWLKDGMIKFIKTQNATIQEETQKILRRIALEEGITNATLVTNGMISLENEKQKVKDY